ncbi:hypothetical protein RRG08_058824 [Elysia crispata]|uniref:Uncharacterized protein n=1 Tax=Elysia crispata TaxID=231223 RepID=A0AAE1AFZ9_9GAST|nr:hypothetical protein RRG08_058824 [Elysia crispata]
MSEVTDYGPGSTGATELDRGDKPTSSLTVEAGGCGVDDEAEISFRAGAYEKKAHQAHQQLQQEISLVGDFLTIMLQSEKTIL